MARASLYAAIMAVFGPSFAGAGEPAGAGPAAFPPRGADLPGLREALDPRVTSAGRTIRIEGPPSSQRDADRESHSADSAEKSFAPRRALPDGVYQTVRKNWLTVKHPDARLPEIARLARERYGKLIAAHVSAPRLTRIDVEPLTLIYPPNYQQNPDPATVRARRLTIHAVDRFGDERRLVAYSLNYDKVDPRQPAVVFQINGHYGTNPSQRVIGMKDRGGYSGAALGILALRGLPLLTYDDHDVGESSPSAGKENGLFRTLANLKTIDEALLVHFRRVDGMGLSGGCERLFHFQALHRCPLKSAYLAGYFNSPWTRLDTPDRMGGPFGSDADTDNETFNRHFQWADLALVGIDRGVDMAFAHQTFEGGNGKNCFVHEMLPALRQYTDKFQLRGDDPDCDGVSNTGRDLAHEYDLLDFLKFLRRTRGAK